MNIGIIVGDSNGGYPVPAVKGGAVSTLIDNLAKENSKKRRTQFTIFSFYSRKAKRESEKYKNTKFIWVKVPKIIKKLDILFYNVVKKKSNVKAISYKSIFSLMYYILWVSNYLRKHSFDKLVLENNIPLIWIIRLTNYQGNFFYHLHNVPRINARCKKFFQRCNGYLCVSNFVANQIESETNPIGPIPSNKIRILYNSIDTRLFKPQDVNKYLFKKENNINSKDQIILFVGRLSKEKGVDILLDSLKYLKLKNFSLLIVGSVMHGSSQKDNYYNYLRKKAKTIPNKIIFLNYVSQENMPYLYNIADLVVLPSVWDEPAGLTMIEALSCGASLITTYSGGIPEYVGKYAKLVKKDSSLKNNLAKAIKEALQENNKNIEAREYVLNNFSLEKYLDNFIEVLK